jgi:hypothetical protein
MNPPGVYDKDPGGFYFIPTYNPQSFVPPSKIRGQFSGTKASRDISSSCRLPIT